MAQPMYREIAEDLRKQIDIGILEPGGRLPTERELRERYNASRNTIKDAIKRLIFQGLVEIRPGLGTFVTMRTEPFVTLLTADHKAIFGGSEAATAPSATTPKVEVLTPPPVISERLRLAPNGQVVSRHQQCYIGGIPWSFETSFYPMELIVRGATRLLIAENITGGAVRYLADAIGLRQIGFRDLITARWADKNEQKFFGISHDDTVFEIFRTAFDQNKKPMRVTVTVLATDRNQFVVDVGDDLPEPQHDEIAGRARLTP
jgi:GntR family transcriptional regulator